MAVSLGRGYSTPLLYQPQEAVREQFQRSHDLLDAAEELRLAAAALEREAANLRRTADIIDPPAPAPPAEQTP